MITAPLEKLFGVYYRWVRLPAVGQFELQTAQGKRTITFNARNLAFDIFYGDLFSENYEDETALLLDAFLPQGGYLYDIGSNWGYFSLYVASRGNDFRIHAFEPIPDTYGDLVSCVKQAGFENTIKCHPLAMSDSEGHNFFQIFCHSASAQVGKLQQGVRVETKTVDSMKLDPPDFIKIDAEGHEAAVLRGAEGTIRACKPFIMFENKLYRDSPEETLQPLLLLTQLGYRLFVPTVQRVCEGIPYFLNCGYQMDTGKTQKIEQEDIMALVPCEAALRFLFPNYLNIFGCHEERMSELRQKFAELQPHSSAP